MFTKLVYSLNNVLFPLLSFTEYNGTNGTKIVNGTKELFGNIGTYGGALYAIAAVFTLILAIRNEDNEGRNKALLNLVAAIALLSTGVIIKLFFNQEGV